MCPVCEEPMVAFELEGVEIDHCVGCRGTWLDAGELEQIAELADVPAGALSEALRTSESSARGKRRCPRCGRRMQAGRVGSSPGTEIDRCPLGHGLWFDLGELRTLITSFAQHDAGAVAAFLANLLRHELDAGREGE